MINFSSQSARLIANKDDPAINHFLGDENRSRIHRLIIQRVYDETNGQVKLGKQSDTELQTIMIHTLQKNFNHHLPIQDLNRVVVNHSVANILQNIAHYTKYITDLNHQKGPLDAPVSARSSRERTNKPIF